MQLVSCLTHRLNFAVKIVSKGLRMDDIIDVFNLVYYFYKVSLVPAFLEICFRNELTTVSLTLQREDIDLSSTVTKQQASELNLKYIHANQSQVLDDSPLDNDTDSYMYKESTLQNFIPDETLIRHKKQIVQSMLDWLHRPECTRCNAFDHKNWPNNDNSALLQYGTDEVKHVFHHFQLLLENAYCDLNGALREFSELKLHVTKIHRGISHKDEDKGDFVNILKIIHLTSVSPFFERVKNDWRCGLSTETLDQLLRIVLSGRPLEDFNARPVVNRWWISGQRKKRPNVVSKT
ncbi:hypothetical protein MAR_003268, partial [Mya arenaria]